MTSNKANSGATRSVLAARSVLDEAVSSETTTNNLDSDGFPEDEDVSFEPRSSLTRSSADRATTTRAKNERLKDGNLINKFLDIIDRPALDIPEHIRERFRREGEGFELRWVRYKEGKNGSDDLANVSKKQRLGYEFVKCSEVPEFSAGLRPVSHKTFGDLITVDDLALAKLPVSHAEAYREALKQKTLNVSQGILEDLNKPSVKRFLQQV
jgi:hypothetical protein